MILPQPLPRMLRHRVMVTGMGAVSGYGWGVDALRAGLLSARTAIGPFSRFDASRHRTSLAAEVPPPPAGWRDGRRWTRSERYALFAAEEALRQAGLAPPWSDETEVGVFFGSSTGGMWEAERFWEGWQAGDNGRPRLSLLASQPVSGPGDAVARHFQVTGPVQTLSSACSSSTQALGAALAAVRSGEVDLAIAGGSDSLCQLTYAGFNALRAVASGACRPFRQERDGMSLGEGAAVLILEPLEAVLARGAVPLAELAGAGASCDAHHMTAPEPSGAGAAAALAAALADAGLPPEEVDFANAHGTGTPLNDSAEWNALERIFGGRARQLPVAATKSEVGHLLGSAGAIEAVATVLDLARREVHPAPAAGPADPALPVRLAVGSSLPVPEARHAVSLNLAFGGSNAALVFSRWTGRTA